jgi:hypothetical protein
MAEYIEKEQALMQLTGRFPQNMSIEKYIGLVNFRINELDTANVIERSKIDNAIEEIEKTENTQEHIFYDGDICARGAFNDGMEKALEILKRNIGEDKENE